MKGADGGGNDFANIFGLKGLARDSPDPPRIPVVRGGGRTKVRVKKCFD